MSTTTNEASASKTKQIALSLKKERQSLENELRAMSIDELIAECIDNQERKEIAVYFLMENNMTTDFDNFVNQIEMEVCNG